MGLEVAESVLSARSDPAVFSAGLEVASLVDEEVGGSARGFPAAAAWVVSSVVEGSMEDVAVSLRAKDGMRAEVGFSGSLVVLLPEVDSVAAAPVWVVGVSVIVEVGAG